MRHHFKDCRVSVSENELLNVIFKGISPIISPIINFTRYCMCNFLQNSEKLSVREFLARFSKVRVLVFLFVVRISVGAGGAGIKGIIFHNQPMAASINL